MLGLNSFSELEVGGAIVLISVLESVGSCATSHAAFLGSPELEEFPRVNTAVDKEPISSEDITSGDVNRFLDISGFCILSLIAQRPILALIGHGDSQPPYE